MPPQYMMVAVWFISGIMYPWEQIGENILIYARGLWYLFVYRCKIISDSRIRKLLAFNSLHVCRHLYHIFNHIVLQTCPIVDVSLEGFSLYWVHQVQYSLMSLSDHSCLYQQESHAHQIASCRYDLFSFVYLKSPYLHSVAISTCLRFPDMFADFVYWYLFALTDIRQFLYASETATPCMYYSINFWQREMTSMVNSSPT